jgi:energy-coupling factor transport system permease protein
MMARFRYLKGDSFFHQMDPTWKFVWNFAVVVALIVNFELSYTVLWYLYLLLLVLFLARIPFKQYVRSMLIFIGIALFIAFWKSVYYVPEEFEQVHQVVAWGPINVTIEGILEGFVSFFRVLAIVTTSIIFTLTTDPAKMVESLIQVAKLPYRIGYTAYAALRFLPIYENEAQVIINAHQIRGVGEPGRSLSSRLKLYRSLLVPLLVSGIRRAQAASIAMDSRAFGAYSKRTHLYDVTVSKAAVAFALVHIGAALAALYYFVILGRGIQFLG